MEKGETIDLHCDGSAYAGICGCCYLETDLTGPGFIQRQVDLLTKFYCFKRMIGLSQLNNLIIERLQWYWQPTTLGSA